MASVLWNRVGTQQPNTIKNKFPIPEMCGSHPSYHIEFAEKSLRSTRKFINVRKYKGRSCVVVQCHAQKSYDHLRQAIRGLTNWVLSRTLLLPWSMVEPILAIDSSWQFVVDITPCDWDTVPQLSRCHHRPCVSYPLHGVNEKQIVPKARGVSFQSRFDNGQVATWCEAQTVNNNKISYRLLERG